MPISLWVVTLSMWMGLGGAGTAVAAPSASSAKPFEVYQWLEGFTQNRPDLRAFGLKEFRLLYPEDLFVQPYPDGNQPRQDLNDRDIQKIVQAGQNLQQAVNRGDIPADALVCIDIEHWPLFAGEVSVLMGNVPADQFDGIIQDSINKYIRVVDTLRKQAPTLRYGFYSMLPLWEWSSETGAPTGDYYASWHVDNRRLLAMARKVDVLFPDLYDPFLYDLETWKKYATGFVNEAKWINSELKTNKPILPFLFPEIWPSQIPLPAGHSDRFLPRGFWDGALETLRSAGADGVMIWDSNVGWRESTPWDSTWGWWQATQDFMKRL